MRRQTAARAGEREVQVLDYQNTAADLLPLVAACYALIFMVPASPALTGGLGGSLSNSHSASHSVCMCLFFILSGCICSASNVD